MLSGLGLLAELCLVSNVVDEGISLEELPVSSRLTEFFCDSLLLLIGHEWLVTIVQD